MENKTLKNVLLIVIAALAIFSMASPIYNILVGKRYISIFSLLSCLFTIYYGFIGYKNPNGKIIKYAMLLFAFSNIFSLISSSNSQIRIISINLIIMIVTYISGRLPKIKQNIVLGCIVIVLLIFNLVERKIYLGNEFSFVAYFRQLPNWLAIFLAYIVRDKEHKEAGLID